MQCKRYIDVFLVLEANNDVARRIDIQEAFSE